MREIAKHGTEQQKIDTAKITHAPDWADVMAEAVLDIPEVKAMADAAEADDEQKAGGPLMDFFSQLLAWLAANPQVWIPILLKLLGL